jgi:hypothetical protein
MENNSGHSHAHGGDIEQDCCQKKSTESLKKEYTGKIQIKQKKYIFFASAMYTLGTVLGIFVKLINNNI